MASPFTCDLVTNARKHKWFLEKIHSLGVSFGPSSKASLHRYKNLWLPLVNEHPEEELIPPADVAWLWHCHRLAPRDYGMYVEETFGKDSRVEANPPFALQSAGEYDDISENAKATRNFWNQKYPDYDFFLSEQSPQASEEADETTLVGDFDLLGSTQRQATFLWQVSGDRFDGDDFLIEGVHNYLRFLQLRPKAADLGVILVPTYQIDLIWHTHILSSLLNYNKDCKAIVGDFFHHDDSLTDRSDGGVLDVAYTATQDLWKQEYGCDYVVEGGMYRGEPPKHYFQAEWNPSQLLIATTNAHLIGKRGASSTSPTITKWAVPGGTTSDGTPAFIPTNKRLRSELVTKGHMDNYVLGKTANGTGYFHMETKDANEILYKRVCMKISKLESDIACATCCGGTKTPKVQRWTAELEQAKEEQRVLRERIGAKKPAGNLNTAVDLSVDDGFASGFAADTCGGAVACDSGAGGAACGGAACTGGGCGGGGCVGGGCGGGGCGGG